MNLTLAVLQEHIKEHFAKSGRKTTVRVVEEAPALTTHSHKCDTCNGVFSSKFALRSHAATHNKQRPYACKECGATFTQNGSLQVSASIEYFDFAPDRPTTDQFSSYFAIIYHICLDDAS